MTGARADFRLRGCDIAQELEAQKDTLTRVKDAVTCGVCLDLLWQPYM